MLFRSSDAPQKVQEAITDGSFSVLLRIQKLGTGAKYKDLGAELFAAAGQKDAMGNTVAPPASGDWSTYEWQPFPELLDGDKTGSGDALKSKVVFANSYVVDNTWVSGSKGVVTLNLSLSGYDLKLTINQAVVTAAFGADRKTADKGVISGVLGTAELTDGIKKIAGTISSGLCSGSALQGVLDQIKQASDIGSDGTQTEGKTCDGISIGLGFGATASKIGKAAPASVPKDACAGMLAIAVPSGRRARWGSERGPIVVLSASLSPRGRAIPRPATRPSPRDERDAGGTPSCAVAPRREDSV